MPEESHPIRFGFRQQPAQFGIETHKLSNTTELRQVVWLGAFWCDCLLRGILRYERVGFCATPEGTVGVLWSRDQVGERVLVFSQDFAEFVREQD